MTPLAALERHAILQGKGAVPLGDTAGLGAGAGKYKAHLHLVVLDRKEIFQMKTKEKKRIHRGDTEANSKGCPGAKAGKFEQPNNSIVSHYNPI